MNINLFKPVKGILKNFIPSIIDGLKPNEKELIDRINALKTNENDEVILVISPEKAKNSNEYELLASFCRFEDGKLKEQISIPYDDGKRSVFRVSEIIKNLLINF